MPLSEHEQRMLDEIERALYQDDPKFATSVNVTRMRRRRPILAGLGLLLGLIMLVVGVISSQSVMVLGVVVSVVGFLVMVAAVGLFIFGQPGGRAATRSPENGARAADATLTDRMEERFRRRFDDQS